MAAQVPLIPGFEQLELLGKGGSSTVYSGVQVDLGRRVAIKVIHVDLGDDVARRRFERECRVVGVLGDVPGIVPVHQSTFTSDGRPCIVMQLMGGGTLSGHVEQHGPISADDAVELAQVLARALAGAHEKGVAHRDIKPGNVLLSGTGTAALADFGISTVDHCSASTQTVESLSPPFAAPERLLGGEIDERLSDLYSLGATLHFAVTGSAPFGTAKDGGVSGLVQRVMNESPRPISRGDVPDTLLTLVEQLLNKRPDARPGTALEVLERLTSTDPASTPAPDPASAPAGNKSATGSIIIPTAPGSAAAPISWVWEGAVESTDQADPDASAHQPSTYESGADLRLANLPPLGPVPVPAVPYSVAGGSDGRSDTTTNDVWPTAVDYVTTVQDPASLLVDELRSASMERDLLGMPVSAAGQSAVVLRVTGETGPAAVRFFTRPPLEGAVRYAALAAHLEVHPCDVLVPARWIHDAIEVDGTRRPAVWMPWADGRPLNLSAEDLLGDPLRLEALAHEITATMRALAAAGIAHGDLQNGNVLVDDRGSVRLVDLDGVWLPSLDGRPPDEAGHRCFQHPARTSADWGPGMDGFSALLIHTSLLALAADPSLWEYQQAENLILTYDDLLAPGATPAWQSMLASPSRSVRELTELLAAQAAAPSPPEFDVVAVLEGLAPAEESTVPRRRSRPVEVTPQATVAPERPKVVSAGSSWWADDAADDSAPTPVDSTSLSVESTPASATPQGDPTRWSRFTPSSPFWYGLVSGLLAGALGLLAGGGAARLLGDDDFPARSAVVFAFAGVASCVLLQLRQADAATSRPTGTGVGVGLLGGFVAFASLLFVVHTYATSVDASPAVTIDVVQVGPLLLLYAIGLAVVAGLGRSLVVAGGGVVGGVVGGLIGTPCVALAQPVIDDGVLRFETGLNPVPLMLLVTFALIPAGVAFGQASVARRRAGP